ncbi:MAG: hypothetical protein IKF37_02240 [Bacilli bacterium]|nr:hypothetical protein [Bacilli bacterium]
MSEEDIKLLDSILKSISNSLIQFHSDRIKALDSLIRSEKEIGRLQELQTEKKQLYDAFSKQVIEFVKKSLSEDQMKTIVTSFLSDKDFIKNINEGYKSHDKDYDTSFYLLTSLFESISDKEFLSEAATNYFSKDFSNEHDFLTEQLNLVYTVLDGYQKPLFLLSYCTDEKLRDSYIKEHIYGKQFIEQFSDFSVFDEKYLVDAAYEYFEEYGKTEKGIKEECHNYLLKNLEYPNISVDCKKKITGIFESKFPGDFNEYEWAYGSFLVDDYESASKYIEEKNLLDTELHEFVAAVKLKKDDLIKLYNDPQVMSRFDVFIPVNRNVDSETAYNIVFHTLYKEQALKNRVFDSALSYANEPLIYGILSHQDSLEYVLKDPKLTKDFIENGVKTLKNPVHNQLFLEIFKESLNQKQLGTLFHPGKLPTGVSMPYYMDDKYCYKLLKTYHPTYNPDGDKNKITDVKKAQNLIAKLYSDNPYLFSTFNPKIMCDELLEFDYKFISTISKYTEIEESIANKLVDSEKIIEANSKEIPTEFDWFQQSYIERYGAPKKLPPIDSKISGKVFLNMLHTIDSIDPTATIGYINDFIEITNLRGVGVDVFGLLFLQDDARSFSKFVVNASNGLDLKTITPEQWKTLTKRFMHDLDNPKTSNYISVDINSIDDINTYDARRKQKIDGIFATAINDKNLDQAINAYFNKFYDIDIDKAKEIISSYGSGLDGVDSEKFASQIANINKIKKILDTKNLQELTGIYQTEKEMTFEDSIKFTNSLSKMYGNSLSKTVSEFQNFPQRSSVRLGFPSNVKVIEPPQDFVLLVHSTDAYGKMELKDDNYKTSWNDSERTRNHGICCSLISNDYLGTADIRDVLLGFGELNDSSLIKAAPYDIFSFNDQLKITSLKKSKFLSPRDIINNTRHGHNELVIERRELDEKKIANGNTNLQPSYVVVYSDMEEGLKNKAIKCAKDFDIPIVYMDREKLVQLESDKIDEMIGELSKEKDIAKKIDKFSEIYLKHENNRCGLAFSDEELKEKFTSGRIEVVLDSIVVDLIEEKNRTHNYTAYTKNVLKLVDALKSEDNKFLVAYEEGSKVAIPDIDSKKYITQMLREIDPTLCSANTSKLSSVGSQIPFDDSALSQELKSIDLGQIEKEIKSINNTEFYQGENPSHNIGHIERVTVLADMIGKKEFANDKNSQFLLRLAAEFHDSGRTMDNKEFNHGNAGAYHVEDLLKESVESGKLSEADMHIVQFAVAYHDTEFYGEDSIKRIAKEFKVNEDDFEKAKKIAFCLKDADALDRVRFHKHSETLDPKYLTSRTAYDLVGTAKQLYAEYQKYDERQLVTKTEELEKEKEKHKGIFKEKEIKFKVKSKFEKLKAKLKGNNKEKEIIEEGEISAVHRGL